MKVKTRKRYVKNKRTGEWRAAGVYDYLDSVNTKIRMFYMT